MVQECNIMSAVYIHGTVKTKINVRPKKITMLDDKPDYSHHFILTHQYSKVNTSGANSELLSDLAVHLILLVKI
jgi:hypothetical protein